MEFGNIIPQLTKAHLHCHLDGSMRIETVLRLLQEQNLKVPGVVENPQELTIETLGKLVYARIDMPDLVSYLKAFDVTLVCLQTRENLTLTVNEIVEDAAKDNITHLELRYAPILHTRQGLTVEQVHSCVCTAAFEAGKKYNVNTTVIVCQMKFIEPASQQTLDTTAVFSKQREVTVAYDEAGPENVFKFTDYKEQIAAVKEAKTAITLHAGEALGADNVRLAMEAGAVRIGHGVRSKEDATVVEEIRNKRVVLEMCPTSNTQTNVQGIQKDLSDYPLRQYLDQNLRVTISCDNTLMSNCTLSSEIQLMAEKCKLSATEILFVMDTAFAAAFENSQEKKEKIRIDAFNKNLALLKTVDPLIEKHFAELKARFE